MMIGAAKEEGELTALVVTVVATATNRLITG